MKIQKLTIKNIGKIAESIIIIDKPLLLFYGEIRQGKSTILNAVRWACGGEFPEDIIRHGESEASVDLEFDGGLISRSWYRSKEGPTKARPVVFIRNGKPVASPVTEIKRFLNPFLLDQDFLRNKSELERKQFFTELFAVDTTALDTELFNKQREAHSLRAKIGGYGEIDVTPVAQVDVSELRKKLSDLRTAYENEAASVNAQNRTAIEHNAKVDGAAETRNQCVAEIAETEKKLTVLKQRLASHDAWLKEHPKQTELSSPATPDTATLEAQLQEAGAQNVRADQFKKNQARANEKKKDEESMAALEKRGREIKAEKLATLCKITETCGIKGLAFDESSNFVYQGTTAGMISDSQIMQLSSELSALYPEGFGLDLIDRAESLGKSIFEFVERAKAEKKTIMATIVGERPAKVPPEIGVFVVAEGKVSA